MDFYFFGAVALVAFGPLLLLYQTQCFSAGSHDWSTPEGGAALFSMLVLATLASCAGLMGMTWMSVILLLGLFLLVLLRMLGAKDDQSILSLFTVMIAYRNKDFTAFLKSHQEAFLEGERTGDYVPGVCNYYELMSDIITMVSGPFWHFVPMTKGLSRMECHDKFHHTTVGFLKAEKCDKILELGCGYGEIGRQVAKISGASVTGLTMADAEIVGGTERIKQAGLQDQCKLVQGNYHKMPFDDCSFDKVFGVYTLKYSADLKTAMSEAARVLKPGGRFVSYEIILTDKFDPNNKEHKDMVHNISYSTCMPPLWHAQAFRDAAKEAGLVLKEETDLGAPTTEDAWYTCFKRTGVPDCKQCGHEACEISGGNPCASQVFRRFLRTPCGASRQRFC